jgi:hypothetical protein
MLDDFRGVLVKRVHGEFGAVLLGEGEFVVRDVHRGDAQAHGHGILDGDVPQPADAGDGDPLPRLGFGHFQSLVDGDAGAEHRGHLHGVRTGGNSGGEPAVHQHVLTEGAVHTVAGVLLGLAQRFPAGAAVLAVAAGGPEPGVAHQVTDGEVCDALAEGHHLAHAFVAGHEGR